MNKSFLNKSAARLLAAQMAILLVLIMLSAAIVSVALAQIKEIRLSVSIPDRLAALGYNSESVEQEIMEIEDRLTAKSKKKHITIAELNTLSSESGLTIQRLVGPDEAQRSSDDIARYQIAYKGDFERSLEFLEVIERQFLCNIQEVTLVAPDPHSSMIELHLVLQAGEK